MTQRKTPLMGWASWNAFRTHISEAIIREQADALVATGLADCGYTYLNIDDGYFGGRGPDGKLLFHATRFPNGIRCIAEYAHSLGLQAGIYSDAGDNTCGHYYDGEGADGFGVGLYGHEESDLRQLLIECDFDFIKVDWCGGLRLNLDEEAQYGKIGRIIQKIREETQKPIVYNVCRWEFPGEWVATVADSWRTGSDIAPNFPSVLYQIDNMKALAKFCTPGHVNDSDMMQLGTGMNSTEERTHFAMWCMLSTPLMIGGDLKKIAPETLAILKNRELIALNQDELCRQAVVVHEYKAADASGNSVLQAEAWVKELSQRTQDGKPLHARAVAFLNRSDTSRTLELSLSEAGAKGKICAIRDICSQKDLPPEQTLRAEVPAHGCAVYLITSTASGTIRDVNRHLRAGVHQYKKISTFRMKQLVKNGAILVDVRSPEEFRSASLPGSINIPYQDIYLNAPQVLPDKAKPIIVYCATGKRSWQAKNRLDSMGYTSVHFLGGVSI